MELNFEQIMIWAIPAAIVAGGLILGLVFEWIIIKSIIRFTKNTKTKWDDVLAASFKGAFVFWITAAASYSALVYAPLPPGWDQTVGNYIIALVTFFIILVLARFVHGAIKLSTANYFKNMPSSSLLPNIAKYVILVAGTAFILQGVGVPIGGVIAGLGIGGLAAALAFRDTLENFFSGIQLLVARKVRVGDFITIGSGETGYVTDISWRETTIRDFNNNLIIIPNAQLSSNIVTNYNLPIHDIFVELVCGVGYDSDLEHVERVVKEVGKEVYKEVIGEELPEGPSFMYLDFADSAINFKTKILVKQFGDRMKVKHPLIKALHKRFKEEGINIPFPIRTIQKMEE